MTAVNLVPLAPKNSNHNAPTLSPTSLLQQYHQLTMTHSASQSNSEKTSPMLRPQPLLLNPDVLMRANLAERLSSHAGLNALTAALHHPSTGMSNAMVTALAQQQYQQQLQRQFFQLQQMQKQEAQQQAQQQTASGMDIIGMGINVPTPKHSNPASPKLAPLKHPSSQQKTKQVPHKKNHKKMLQFGKPLMAPPRLASKICPSKKMSGLKRPAAPLRPLSSQMEDSQQPMAVRRVSYTSDPKKTLSADELDFVEAAQQLSHSPLASPKTLSPAMASKALKAPPGLHF